MRKFLFVLAASIAITTSSVLAQHEHYTGPQCMSNCPGDVGPNADTAAVRAAMVREMHGPRLMLGHINVVHVVGDYALLTVGNPGEPATFVFKRISGERWKTNDEGGWGMRDLLHSVPAPVAKKLCSGKWPTMRSGQVLPSGETRYTEVSTSPCKWY